MKKHFIGLAALSMLFLAASCTNETIESATDGDPLTFRTVLGKQTLSRATETDLAGLQAKATSSAAIPIKSFLVGNTTPFHDFGLYWDSSSSQWTYGTSVMSPGVALRYYSWYPNTSAVTGAAVSAAAYSFEYVVNGVATQEDLIAATATTAGNVVDLNYKHLLSQVNFGIVKTFGLYVEIDPTSIIVNDVKNAGTYTFGTSWVLGASTADYTYDPLTGTNVTDGTATTPISYMGNGATYDKDNALMLMPQTFATATDGTITFNFKLWRNDTSGVKEYLAGGDAEYVTATANLCDFTTTEWLSGKRYLYLFDFSGYLGPQQAITFTVFVSEWLNDDHATIAETLQVADNQKETIEAAIAKHATAKTTSGNVLTVFPITVTVAIDASIELTLPIDNSFATDDEIRIECLDNASAANISLESAMGTAWQLTSPTGEGKVVKIKKI